MSGTSTPTFTPGLTHGQRHAVADALRRVGGVPLGLLALVFMDVDRAAAQAFSPRNAVRAALRGEDIKDQVRTTSDLPQYVAAEHGVSVSAAAFAYGCAIGLRLGRQFWPRSERPRRYISDDYRRLDRNQKDRVTRIIRGMLTGYDVIMKPGPKPGPQRQTIIEADLAAGARWKRESGQRVRNEARR